MLPPKRGVDVVLAYFEPHARPDTIEQAQGLEIVPHRKIEYRGKIFEEMDTEAVLRAQANHRVGRRISAYQYSWLDSHQTLGRCSSPAGCRHRSVDHNERATYRKPQ